MTETDENFNSSGIPVNNENIAEKAEKTEKAEKAEKTEKADKTEKTGKGDKGNKTDNAEKKPWYKKPVFVKLGYALIALIVAVTCWGYVLVSENPPRTKRLDNIPLSFESGSESDLAAKNLIILGDIHEILQNVSVEVETTLNDLPRFNKASAGDIVQASVSVRNVHEAGEYQLNINAVSTIGEVVSITPSFIKITVDDLISRPVPIICNLTGKLPDDYWHGDAQLAAASTTVKGAKSIVDKIVRAVCTVDLDGRTEPVNDSFKLTMYDEDRNVIESGRADAVFPSVIVKMDIRPTLDIKVEPVVLGADRMNDIYEIASVNIIPHKITLAADKQRLNEIKDMIVFDPPVDLANVASEGVVEYEISVLNLPDDVLVIGANRFIVKIEIRERIEEKTFENISVSFINEDRSKYSYNFIDTQCSVTLSGKASYIRQLNSWDINLVMNLDGKGAGVYTLIPEIEFKEPELYQELTFVITELNFEIRPV